MMCVWINFHTAYRLSAIGVRCFLFMARGAISKVDPVERVELL